MLNTPAIDIESSTERIDITMHQLHCFAVLVQTGHFETAANKLDITRSGLSVNIDRLETICGRFLIQRGKNGVKRLHKVQLTPYGRKIYHMAIVMVRAMHKIQNKEIFY